LVIEELGIPTSSSFLKKGKLYPEVMVDLVVSNLTEVVEYRSPYFRLS